MQAVIKRWWQRRRITWSGTNWPFTHLFCKSILERIHSIRARNTLSPRFRDAAAPEARPAIATKLFMQAVIKRWWQRRRITWSGTNWPFTHLFCKSILERIHSIRARNALSPRFRDATAPEASPLALLLMQSGFKTWSCRLMSLIWCAFGSYSSLERIQTCIAIASLNFLLHASTCCMVITFTRFPL